jgi:two-component system response regulator
MTDRESVKVLLVEDDLGHAELVRRNLQRSGGTLRLSHVADGQEALDYLRREGEYAGANDHPDPDLILLDLRLPRVDGLEVLRQIKQDPALARIPVVILTTSQSSPDIAEAYARRANSYLVKPVDFQRFGDLMEEVKRYWTVWNEYPGR